MDILSDILLREEGYEPFYDSGYISALGVSVRKSPGGAEMYSKLAARRVEYVRGTPFDRDAEVVPVAIFSELVMIPLARNREDIADSCKRAYHRMAFPEDVVGTVLAIDAGPGEGALVVNELRRIRSIGSALFPLTTVGDPLAVQPHIAQMPGGGATGKINDHALVEGFAARATSGQVLIDNNASDDTRLAFLQAMREAGRSETSVEAPLTRIMAWASEILLRPLVAPVFRVDPSAVSRTGPANGRMKIGR